MSIPVNQLVYGGIWDAAKRYTQYTFVVSPIDLLCYVNINDLPSQGGADPSVQPSAYWLLFPNVTGDITGVVAGVGLSGGGTTGSVVLDNIGVTSFGVVSPGLINNGTDTDPVVENTGVLSLDGQTGALTTKCGGFHRNTAQTINTIGSPSSVSIAWGQSSYGDTTTISQNVAGGANFTVNQSGIYLLTLQVSYGNLASATLTDRTLRTSITITRGTGTSAIVQGNYDFGDNVPPTPAVTSAAMYELKQGDQLFFQVSQYLSAGSFILQGKAAAPNDFDLNTYWSWVLLQPLP